MSLSSPARRFVATAYEAGLSLEDVLGFAGNVPGTVRRFGGTDVLRTALDKVCPLSASDSEEWRSLWIHKWLAVPDEPFPSLTDPRTQQAATAALTFLQSHVSACVGAREADQADAFLILMYVERRARGTGFYRTADYASWLGLKPEDVEEMVKSRALAGLVEAQLDGLESSVRITFDGRKLVDTWLHQGDDEALDSTGVRATEPVLSSPARVEGWIEELHLRDIFSFGPDAEPIRLGKLNVLIGANGSGKSNILEAIELLASSPHDLQAAVREAGGIDDVVHKRRTQGAGVATIEAVVRFAHRDDPMRHRIRFTARDQRFEVEDERIENAEGQGGTRPLLFFGHEPRGPMISALDDARRRRQLVPVRLPPMKSILSERREPARYPELGDLAAFYEGVRTYRESLFGRRTAPRFPQPTDLPNDFLREDASNLGMVLSRVQLDASAKSVIVEKLRDVCESVRDIFTKVEGGTIQVFLQDEGFPISARRISDGTLRFLCLLVVLCDPFPPPVVLIDEPELGLHPDAIGTVADLLREASERTQLVVTTHSEALVDRFTDTPEDVLTVDKTEGKSRVVRRDRAELAAWLEKFSLGRLWRMGELGGNRW